MLDKEPVVIDSVSPLQGHEGTIVTIKGRGFDAFNPVRNNCVVIGGMGACARVQPGSTSTELKVRIGPVARGQEGDLLMWPGVGVDLHTDRLAFGKADLRFSEVAVFRNSAPVASAGIKFKLTQASPDTYAGQLQKTPASLVELGGHERGNVMCVSFPKTAQLSKHSSVDVCAVLKEPTLAIDFTAQISGDDEDRIRGIAKSIVVNASLIGEKVLADVARNPKTGDLELYVTKPYLQNGMITVHFGAG